MMAKCSLFLFEQYPRRAKTSLKSSKAETARVILGARH